MQAAFDGAERAARLRERRKDTHQRIDLWLPNEVFGKLDDLCGFYGENRLAMIQRIIEDRHAAWSEGSDDPAPAVQTFKGKQPCPTCTGQAHVQAFADTNGICPTCGNARVVPADE